MNEGRVGASYTGLDPTRENCVGPFSLFVSVAPQGRRGWQIAVNLTVGSFERRKMIKFRSVMTLPVWFYLLPVPLPVWFPVPVWFYHGAERR